MTPKKSSGKGKRSGNRGIKDLSVSDAKAKNTKGGIGSAFSEVVKNLGDAMSSMAKKG